MKQRIFAAGLMSGTSADGIDIAIIETDGEDFVRPVGGFTHQYPADLRQELLEAAQEQRASRPLEKTITNQHIKVCQQMQERFPALWEQVEIIGFHGHTIFHDPTKKRTEQIGDGSVLAQKFKKKVVVNFRRQDITSGGQGAPLVPVFHRALIAQLPKPVAIVNIGGVANITWIGEDGKMMAFDTGPGNALTDDWMRQHTGRTYDHNGEMAARGTANEAMVLSWLDTQYLAQAAPKSLDRNAFISCMHDVKDMSVEDGAATLTTFTAASILESAKLLPERPKAWIICGGGRLNSYLMQQLRAFADEPVLNADKVGWNGDLLEAEAFAYLSVRRLHMLPATFPETTGVKKPVPAGMLIAA